MMTFLPYAASVAVGLLLVCCASPVEGQNASPSITQSPSPTASAAPTAVPLPDIVSASDSALDRLNQIQAELSSNKIVDTTTRELAAMTKELDARELETQRILRRGVPLETLRDFEARWQKLGDQVTALSRQLTDRANMLENELAQMSATDATWKVTLELARQSNAPSEVTQRVNEVLRGTDGTVKMLQKQRAAVL